MAAGYTDDGKNLMLDALGTAGAWASKQGNKLWHTIITEIYKQKF